MSQNTNTLPPYHSLPARLLCFHDGSRQIKTHEGSAKIAATLRKRLNVFRQNRLRVSKTGRAPSSNVSFVPGSRGLILGARDLRCWNFFGRF